MGSVPRKQGGGGDQWMRSTSRNVRAMRRQERSLDLAQGRELHPAEGQRVGGCKKGIYPTVFQLTPPDSSRHKHRHLVPYSNQPWIIWG